MMVFMSINQFQVKIKEVTKKREKDQVLLKNRFVAVDDEEKRYPVNLIKSSCFP